MKSFLWMLQRNLRIYVRDRSGLFFSLLASLILLMIYALFLGRMQAESLAKSFPQASTTACHAFVTAWAFAGILSVSCFSVPLSALSLFVDDNLSGRFKNYRVCSLKRSTLISAYFAGSTVISLVQNLLIYLLGTAFLYFKYNLFPSFQQILVTVGLLLLLALFYSSLMGLAVTYMRSTHAYSSFASIAGTLIGFLSCAYIPVGAMDESIANVMNVLPFSSTSMLLRKPIAGDALHQLSNGIAQIEDTLSDVYGFTLYIQKHVLSPKWVLGEVFLLFLLCGWLTVIRMHRKIQ